MLWPDYFPDDCPPNSAQPPPGQVYRFINSDSPQPEDFHSWREQHLDQSCPKGVTECQACGLSVFTTREGVCIALRRKPFLRRKQIAIGQLTTENGVLLHTPSKGTGDNHHTWWIPINIESWRVFQVTTIDCSNLTK